MAMRQYRPSAYGGRHTRKKSRRPPPLPKIPLQDKRKCVSPLMTRSDEDYVNLGHKHKLTLLRYPSGSGKRPPPKPKRIQEEGSPPLFIQSMSPTFRSPPPMITFRSPPPNFRSSPPFVPPMATTRTRPKHGPLRPKVAPRPNSPSQHRVMQATPTPKKSPKLPPARPLLPPNRKLPRAPSQETNLEDVSTQGQKKPPPKQSPKLQVCPDTSTPCLRKCQVKSQDTLFHLNGFFNKELNSKLGEVSAAESPTALANSTMVPASSRPPKQPLLPPAVKPRKANRKQETSNNLLHIEPVDLPNTPLALHQQLPASPTSPKQKKPSLPSSSPTEAQDKAVPFLPYMSELHANSKAPLPKPRPHRPSRDDDNIDPSFSCSQTPQEASLGVNGGSPTRPVARRRLGSKGASTSTQGGEMLSSSPTSSQEAPLSSTPRPRPADDKTTSGSMQVQTSTDKPGAGAGLVFKAPPIPRKRPGKEALESNRVQPAKAAPSTRQQHQQHQQPLSLPPVAAPNTRQQHQQPSSLQPVAAPNTRQQPLSLPPVAAPNTRQQPPSLPPAAAPNIYQQLSSLRARKKGGGIRIPLWKAPPPPSWTPPATLEKEKRSAPLLLPLSALHVSPPSSPAYTSSTSFILPPFRASSHSPYPDPASDLETSWVMDYEPPVVEICLSPTLKSPLTVEFEENLFNYNPVLNNGGSGSQQQLPISVVQELQNNLRKQIETRS